MKLPILTLLLLIACGNVWAAPSCTIHGTAGAASSMVVPKNDVSPGRVYMFIQNTGTSNGLNFSIGQTGGATASDVYLAPGAAFSFPAFGQSSFTTPIVPNGEVDVIQNQGSTTYVFCDF